MSSITDGIAIGGAGGFIAGFTVYLVQHLHAKALNYSESKRVYNWLNEKTSNKAGDQFRSTRAIASWNNLTEDRVRYLCSTHNKIFLSTGDKEDMWGIHSRRPKSVYEERGITSV